MDLRVRQISLAADGIGVPSYEGDAMTAEFTSQQANAIAARDVSIALAAGAGCGKTFVLTERFLACLDPERRGGPLRLDQLTAITFTERAAREMRERIRKTCLQRLEAAPEKHVEHWLRRFATWTRRGFPRSIRFAARCSAPTRWKPGSTRALRCSTPRPPRRCSLS